MVFSSLPLVLHVIIVETIKEEYYSRSKGDYVTTISSHETELLITYPKTGLARSFVASLVSDIAPVVPGTYSYNKLAEPDMNEGEVQAISLGKCWYERRQKSDLEG